MKIIFIFVACLVTWACTPLIYNFIIPYYDTSTLVNRGTFGDSFGVVTSLFSLFSFVAVLYVLQQTQHKDGEKERPFVLTLVDEQSLPVKFYADESQKTLLLSIQINVKNYSEYLAHSLIVKCWVECKNKKFGGKKLHINHPINSSEKTLPAINLNLDVKENMDVLDALTGPEPVKINFELEYKNTSNHTFKTINSYSVDVADSDFERFNCLRRLEFKNEYWGGGKFVSCKINESDDFVK